MSGALYIAVEGPIGVGKTTLVTGLQRRTNARLVLEVVEENPFLPAFYANRDRFAFQTQLFFLMSRFKQQEELHQADLFRPNLTVDRIQTLSNSTGTVDVCLFSDYDLLILTPVASFPGGTSTTKACTSDQNVDIVFNNCLVSH